MAVDISEELNTIETVLRGEDVRDAIVSAFRKVNTTGIGVMLTTEEWDELTEDEKNNGTMYFVSDMNIVDGDNYYFSDYVSNDKLLISHELLRDIVVKLKNLLSLTESVSLSDLSTLLDTILEGGYIGTGPTGRIRRITGRLYIANGTTYNENATHIVDVYPAKEETLYMIMIGETPGTRFRVGFFTTDPTYPTEVTGVTGVNIKSDNTAPKAWTNLTYRAPSDGYILVYADNIGNTDVTTYVIPIEKVVGIDNT